MPPDPSAHQAFPPTRWTLVARLRAGEEDRCREAALSQLCEIYWPPIYSFLRSKGYSKEEAEDLAQGFFADFLGRNHFARASSELGKLRSYLLGAVSNYTRRIHRDRNRLKRGGGQFSVPLDRRDGGGKLLTLEPVDGTTPEIAFEKQWVVTLLEHVFASVRAEYEEKGKADLFDALKFVVSAGAAGRPYAEIAEDLGCSEGTVKVCVHRLRGRYQERLREAVADTLLPEESVDEEIRYLMAVFD